MYFGGHDALVREREKEETKEETLSKLAGL